MEAKRIEGRPPDPSSLKMDRPPYRDGEWVFLRGRVVGCIDDGNQVVAMVEAHKTDGKPSDTHGFAVYYWPVDSIVKVEDVKAAKERGTAGPC